MHCRSRLCRRTGVVAMIVLFPGGPSRLPIRRTSAVKPIPKQAGAEQPVQSAAWPAALRIPRQAGASAGSPRACAESRSLLS